MTPFTFSVSIFALSIKALISPLKHFRQILGGLKQLKDMPNLAKNTKKETVEIKVDLKTPQFQFSIKHQLQEHGVDLNACSQLN